MDDEIAREMTQNHILEDSLKKAKLSNAAKDVFLANMSHDIRTPLNAIFGFTKLAKKNSHDSDIVKPVSYTHLKLLLCQSIKLELEL